MLKNKAKIYLIDKLELPNARLHLYEKYLIVLTQGTNYFYDVSIPAKPLMQSEFSLAKDKADYANTFLGMKGHKAFFNIGYSGIEVVDVQEARRPINLGLMRDILIGARWEFYGKKYLITNLKIPVIYDISEFSEPKISYKFNEEIMDLIVLGKNVLCASPAMGIKLFDLSQLEHPRIISSIDIKATKLIQYDSKTIVAEGIDSVLYILDISKPRNIEVISKIEVPGTIAANSLLLKDSILFLRFMRKRAADTTIAFNISRVEKPVKINYFESSNMPLYTATEKLLVLMGIKDWDGVQPIANFKTCFYKFYSVRPEKLVHIDDIELDGIWFSSFLGRGNVVYISRADGIYVYEVRVE